MTPVCYVTARAMRNAMSLVFGARAGEDGGRQRQRKGRGQAVQIVEDAFVQVARVRVQHRRHRRRARRSTGSRVRAEASVMRAAETPETVSVMDSIGEGGRHEGPPAREPDAACLALRRPAPDGA